MRSLTRRNGIVLISVLFLTVLIGMYVTSAFFLSRGQLLTANLSREDQIAASAAKSGIQYALARLEENADWRGDGNGVMVDSADLTVVEDNGNVVGLVRYADGAKAQFRIRFNYQDGAAGGDDLDDPSGQMIIDNPHVSVNNLVAPDDATLPYGDGANYSVVGNVAAYPVPQGAVALICEGRVSSDLDAASATNPNPKLNRITSSRVVEEFHKIVDVQGARQVEPAVSMAARKMKVDLFDGDATNPAQLVLNDQTAGGQPKTRSRDGFEVRDEAGNLGAVEGHDAQVMVLDPNDPNQLQAQLHPGVEGAVEDPNTAFYELTWGQVETASATAGQMQAGVYVYWETDKSVHYYDMSHEQYMEHIQTNPLDAGQPAALPDGMTFVPANRQGPDGETSDRLRFVVTGDIDIQGTTNSDDLSILPRSGAKETLDKQAAGGAGGTYRTSVDWSAKMTSLPGKGAAVGLKRSAVDGFINDIFVYGSASDQLSFLQELAPSGEIDSQAGQVKWDKGGIYQVQGDKGEALRRFARGESDTLIKNIPQGTLNPSIFDASRSDSLGDLQKLYDYFKEGGGGGQGEPPPVVSNEINPIDLPTLTGGAITPADEPHGAGDFEVTFAPASEEGIRITGPGDVRIAADVRGSGASIKAEGQIRLVGVGFDLATNANEEGPSVSLYAQDDIAISTLRKKNGSDYEYTGLDFKGIIYSWKDVVLSTGHSAEDPSANPQKVRIQGTIVAYGGDPEKEQPGEGGGGNLLISGDQVELIFDPSYLVSISGGSGLRAKLGLVSSNAR